MNGGGETVCVLGRVVLGVVGFRGRLESDAPDLPLVLSVLFVGSVVVSLLAEAELSVASVDLLCDDGSAAEVSRVLLSEDDVALSERRGARSEVGVLLAAAVLESTSAPNWSFAFDACDRVAGFDGTVWTDTLAATSDDTLTTESPLQ